MGISYRLISLSAPRIRFWPGSDPRTTCCIIFCSSLFFTGRKFESIAGLADSATASKSLRKLVNVNAFKKMTIIYTVASKFGFEFMKVLNAESSVAQ